MWPRKGARVWGALGRDGEWAAAHANPWVPGAWKLAPPGLCVLGRGGRGGKGGTGPCGCPGLGEETEERRAPRPWGGSEEKAVAELGREGEVLRLSAGTQPESGGSRGTGRRGLPKWVRQAPASGLLPRALLGCRPGWCEVWARS